MSIDANEFPELSLLAQSGSVEGWLSSIGVEATGFGGDPCESQFFGAAAAAVTTTGGIIMMLFGDPITKVGGAVAAIGGALWYIQTLEDLAACLDANGRLPEASAIWQHTGALRAECDRLQSFASTS